MSYNINVNIYYENDDEYRECLSKVFKKNENDRGSFFISRGVDYIFEKTKNNPTFGKLYEKASHTVHCSNMNVGVTILFSYDYFVFFHMCLVEYFHNTEHFNENNGKFKLLMEKLD